MKLTQMHNLLEKKLANKILSQWRNPRDAYLSLSCRDKGSISGPELNTFLEQWGFYLSVPVLIYIYIYIYSVTHVGISEII